ncbi:hypothetical protein QQS21_011686 [Conoideocrella luteorostrata]|uniref:Uncharacterized protein n=1 Tax=Conoideocrella luteorostrata TaxID=1105319 RepID=A0AAJ0CCX0_9HYPO|nr:hypothetical protein QQS21_011686 [Conoideocrella luteorostrata]
MEGLSKHNSLYPYCHYKCSALYPLTPDRLAVSAVADVTSINIALLTITKDLVALNSTLANFSGDVFAAIPILGSLNKLLGSIRADANTAKKSAPLNFNDTLIIDESTADLVEDSTQTLNTLIAAKPKFDKLYIVTPINLGFTKNRREATANLSSALIENVPANLQPVAKALVQGIDDDFARGAKAYGG